MNQNKTCGRHKNNKIMFICLERGCNQVRLFCFDCRNNHQNHHYVPYEEIQQRFFTSHNEECDKALRLMEQRFVAIKQTFEQFVQGLRNKFILTPDAFTNLDILQQHQVIEELIKFKSFDEKFMVQIKEKIDQMIELLDKLFKEHTLNEIQYVDIDTSQQDQSLAYLIASTDLMETKQFNKAVNTLKLSIHADPNNWEAHFVLGNALMEINEYQQAQNSFEQAFSLNKTSLDAQYRIGEALIKQRKFKEALKIYEQLYSKDQTTFRSLYGKGMIYCYLADCLVGMGSKGEAIQILNKILRISPNCLEAKRKLEFLSK